MNYEVISSDGHVDLAYLPPELFVENASAHLVDRMPRVVDKGEGPEWWANGMYLAVSGRRAKALLTPENEARIDRIAETGFYEDAARGRPRPTDPELRIGDQDRDGVNAEVIYGLTFIGGRLMAGYNFPGGTRVTEPNPDVMVELFRIYNDWMADFCRTSPERLAGLACLPNNDPQTAASELRRAASMGLRGAELDVHGAGVPVYYEDWDPLWEAAQECEMPISFHLLNWGPREPKAPDIPKYNRIWWTMDMVLSPLFGAEFLTSILLSGACKRFPGFKFVLGECGAAWVPFMLDRLDHECTGFPGLEASPVEYWRRQGHTTYQDEDLVADLIDKIGEDNVMWGSDYPHPDSVWPDSRETIERNLGRVRDPGVRRKVVCENAGRLYGFL